MIQQKIKHFWKNEEAQTTIEYVLMLSISVGFLLSFKKIFGPALSKFGSDLNQSIEHLFLKSDLHRFSIKR